ncbi:hypothetical protein D922_00969 [Enterococcus faecalis 06-MB-DW-09]|nr:hypothetical protein D922_00969 [Enterococcus faecalis 06-MB-DW-09]
MFTKNECLVIGNVLLFSFITKNPTDGVLVIFQIYFSFLLKTR